MPTNFPTSVDNFTNPTANDSLNLPSHSTQHANANDAIEAIEGYLLNGGQGLTLVKKQTIFNGVTTVAVTNAFSATYEAYKVVIAGGGLSGNDYLTFALSANSHNYAFNYVDYAGAASYARGANAANFAYVGYGFGSSSGIGMNLDVINPFLARFTFIGTAPTAGDVWGGTTTGIHKQNVSYSGFTIGTGGAAFTGGTIYVYGYGIGQ